MTVRFGKPEAQIVRLLAARLPGVAVATRAPQTLPALFVRPVAIGGSVRTAALSQRLVQLHFYAATASAAADLAETVLAALVAAGQDPTEKTVRRVDVVGEPAAYPDPDTDRPRYSATVALWLRGTPQP
ncbi:hypothetical protein MYK68_13990 [Gordonia sp. PP30]|uniref:hypothetical protein n=1 Tax=Gordonia sp. PP30 TaxID=2935861 RepID=UPI001FFE924C|nr:hypothetical protein [Gordonia sp. PP30]UQE73841.1 hypothetical protein MYK68_13990 [Gordonia sp. PP30]